MILLPRIIKLKIKVEDKTITSWTDGIQVDKRTLSGNMVRKNGSIGFGAVGAIVQNVKIETPSNSAP